MPAWGEIEDDAPVAFRPGEGYRPALGRAVCRRVAAGESVRRICAEPAMPAAHTLYLWAREVPEFAAMLGEARREAANHQRDRREERAQARLWKPPKGRGGRPTGYTPERGDAVCVGLIEGLSLAAVCARPGMPSVVTVYNWLHRHADFVRAYGLARLIQADVLAGEAWEAVADATPETVAVARLRFDAVRARAWRIAPWKFGLGQGSASDPPVEVRVVYERAGT